MNLDNLEQVKELLGRDFQGFYPWVGSEFDPTRDIFLVGDSHYDDQERLEGEAAPNFEQRSETIDLIRGRPNWVREDEKRFVKASERFFEAFDGARYGQCSWSRVAFYNFCNRYMPRRRHVPSESTFKDSVEPFRRVMEAIKPKLIVISGVRIFDRLMHYSNIRKKLLREGLRRADKAAIDLDFAHEIIPIRHLSRSSPVNTAKTVRQLMIAGFSHEEPI